MLDAARLLSNRKDTLFVFAGPDVRNNSRAFARAPKNVRWLGSVPHELRDSLLSACTVLCVPSSRESFGSVVVEAWACGKPVVGGPAGGGGETAVGVGDDVLSAGEAGITADALGD